MLKNTFCHIPSVSLQKENKFWSCGVLSWDDIVEKYYPQQYLGYRLNNIVKFIGYSIDQLMNENAQYFAQNLPPSLHWRLFPEFRNSTAYLDIETTGLSCPPEYITTIALYNGKSINYYINGKNLHDFVNDIMQYKLIVTYNGKCFDVPFIQNYFNIKLDTVHIDLRYVLKSLGYTGGLKGCERKLGIQRGELENIDGYFAVLLWREYKMFKDEQALETLLAYNIQDVLNLETLMVLAYNMKINDTPFANTHRISLPTQPENPFKAHPNIIQKIRQRYFQFY